MSLTKTVLVAWLAGCLWAASTHGNQTARAAERWTAQEQAAGYVVFAHNTQENLPRLHMPERRQIGKPLTCSLARDEYESIQFGVHAIAADVTAVEVQVESDLDVEIYRRIDPEMKEALAVAAAHDDGILRWVPSEIHLQRSDLFAELPAGDTVNFWLTFRADIDARAGRHRGKVRIRAAGRPETVLDLVITVRPFELQRPRISFGAWMREDMLPKRLGSLDTPEETVLEIYRDMAAHGHNSNWFYPVGVFDPLPPERNHWLHKLMPLAEQAGLMDPLVPSQMAGGGFGDFDLQQGRAVAKWLKDLCADRGWPEMVVFGPDEPKYPADYNRVHEALGPLRGISVRVNLDQSNVSSVFGYSTPGLADIHNVQDGCISPEMVAELQRQGSETFMYSYRILRENFYPFRQRFFAGFYTWALDLGGNWIWAYHYGHHRHAWFALDSHQPQPITGWEARREGIDDYRYLQMLGDCVAAHPNHRKSAEAGTWLAALRKRLADTTPNLVELGDPLTLDEYDEIRDTAARYIQLLGPVSKDFAPRPEPRQALDEAAPYRGRSVAECVAGLHSSNVGDRRAAAWALHEMGADAAAAVEPLAAALDYPELRMPALHALGAIGLDAAPAVPQIARLLDHPDFFVRTGTALTLGEIGCPISVRDRSGRRSPSAHAALVAEHLIGLIDDPYASICYDAGEMIGALGEHGRPVVPQVIEMLDDPEYLRNRSALGIVTGLGPHAVAATSKLIEMHQEKPEDTGYIDALSAIGPGAAAAVELLEAFVAGQSPGTAQATGYYALACIRGDVDDMNKLVELLQDEGARPHVAKLLTQLGANGKPIVDDVRQLIAAGGLEDVEEELQSFLNNVEQGEVPGVRYDW